MYLSGVWVHIRGHLVHGYQYLTTSGVLVVLSDNARHLGRMGLRQDARDTLDTQDTPNHCQGGNVTLLRYEISREGS